MNILPDDALERIAELYAEAQIGIVTGTFNGVAEFIEAATGFITEKGKSDMDYDEAKIAAWADKPASQADSLVDHCAAAFDELAERQQKLRECCERLRAEVIKTENEITYLDDRMKQIQAAANALKQPTTRDMVHSQRIPER